MIIGWSIILTYFVIAFVERRRHKVFLSFMEKDHRILYYHKVISKSTLDTIDQIVGATKGNPTGDSKKKEKFLGASAVFLFFFWPFVYKMMNRVRTIPFSNNATE